MTYEHGRVVNVYTRDTGGEVQNDAAAGATVIYMVNAYAFNETGGSFVIEDTTTPIAYASADPDADTITLTAPLAAGISAETTLLVWPLGQEKVAQVELDDNDEGPLCLVPFAMSDKFDVGIRDPSDQESVLITDQSGRWELYAMDDQIPVILGQYFPPIDTLPGPVIAPTVSPEPTVVGGIGSLFVSFAPIAFQQVTVDVHLSLATGFMPDGTTLVKTVSGTNATITTLPDGVTALSPNTTYYIKLVAHNPAGYAPPSNEAPGSLHLIDTPDISVAAAWVGTMTVDKLLGGTLSAEAVLAGGGGLVARGADGSSVQMKPEGFKVYGSDALSNPVYINFPTDGGPNVISSTLVSKTLEVSGDPTTGVAASFFQQSELAQGATLRINSGAQTPSAAPIVTQELSTIKFGTSNPNRIFRGGYYDSATGKLTAWVDTDVLDSTSKAVEMSTPGSGFNTIGSTIMTYGTPNGVGYSGAPFAMLPTLAKIGTSYYSAWWLGAAGGVTRFHIGKYGSSVYYQVPTGAVGASGWLVPLTSGDLLFIFWDNTGLLNWSRLTVGTSINAVAAGNFGIHQSDLADGEEIRGGLHGAFDIGTTGLMLYTNLKTYWFTGTTAFVRNTAEDFNLAADTGVLFWDGAVFKSISDNPTLPLVSTYSNAAAGTYWAASTRYNASGPKETVMSPLQSFTAKKRWYTRYTVSGPGVPSMRIYQGSGAGTPMRTAMYYFATLTMDVNSQGTTLDDNPAPNTANANPPATSTFPNDNPAQITSTGGGSYWKGDDTALFLRLIVNSTTDASTAAGNTPALRVGNVAGTHLRIDGDEVISMQNDTTQGTLKLNLLGGTTIGRGSQIKGYDCGNDTKTTNTNGDITVNHNIGVNPITVVHTPGSAHTMYVVTKDATSITFRCSNKNTGALLGSGVSVQVLWAAFA